MQKKGLYRLLQNPKLYPDKPRKVSTIQTHISYVILAGNYAYKVKKPVNFGFLDFSTLKKRKYYCKQELKLNQRLSRELYLEVVPITKTKYGLELAGRGRVVEYALKMKQMPQSSIMTHLTRRNKIGKNTVRKIADKIADFHKKAHTNTRIQKFGNVSVVKKNTDENFTQTKEFINRTITKKQYSYIKQRTDEFLRRNRRLFKERIRKGKIRDCHGDLHTGNVFVTDKIYIFDCIEFNESFRYDDVALDVAFMAMDLDFLGRKDLSDFFVQEYIRCSKDKQLVELLDFCKCYRAYVKGKVISFKLNDPNINRREKAASVQLAKKYFTLSYSYARRLSKPTLYIMYGLTGTGKSYVAKQLSKHDDARILRMDTIRKRLAGIKGNIFEKYGKGMFSRQMTDLVYKKTTEMAKKLLQERKSCIIDATFKLRRHRELARNTALRANANFLIVKCKCREDIVRKRLQKRFRKKSVSDGRWEIYVQQKVDFEPLTKHERTLTIDTSGSFLDVKKNVSRTVKHLNKF